MRIGALAQTGELLQEEEIQSMRVLPAKPVVLIILSRQVLRNVAPIVLYFL